MDQTTNLLPPYPVWYRKCNEHLTEVPRRQQNIFDICERGDQF